MKIDRLLGIVTTLLQKGKSTAPELAKKFEVSTRTIFRDVDDICKAGIPLVAMQGGGGGIAIAEGYRLNHSALTNEEMQDILAGLKGIGSVTAEPRVERLIDKLTPGRQSVVSMKDNIVIDLASHYKASLSDKIALIKKAISENRLLGFEYYSEKGHANRAIEPYYIAFKWSAWYVFGYCTERGDFRLFKLNRMWDTEVLERYFRPREIPVDETSLDDYFEDTESATVLFESSAEYLIAEEYGPESYERLDDGRLKMKLHYTNRKYIVRWLLGFGGGAVVLNPPDLAQEMQDAVKKMQKNYRMDR
jgi:predicted DNA-binding transcriptional regulator YafY